MKLLSDMAEGLAARGHDVTVLTGFPNWPSGKIYPGYRQRLAQREVVNGVKLIRIPLYPNHSHNPLKRVANFFSFTLTASLLGPLLVPKADVMHVVHPPITVGLPAWLICQLKRIPFTLEINDMWPENLSATGMVNNQHILRAVGSFAQWVYHRARRIRVISEGFRTNLLEKGVSAAKIRVISNWVDTEFYRPLPKSSELMERFGMRGYFNFLYAGTIGAAQGLDTVLDAADILRKSRSNIQFVLAGDGIEYERLRRLASTRKLSNVRFLGRLPGDIMPDLYACADVLLLHLRADPLYAITIPHKVFTYMAAGKPILIGAEGDAAEVVTKAEAGIAAKPGNARALAAAAQQFVDMTQAEREAFGSCGRRTVCKEYSRESLLVSLETMLKEATGQ